MSNTDITYDEANTIRNSNTDNAVGLMEIAQAHGWDDAEIARQYNIQHGAGGNWTAESVTKHKAWLASAGIWTPATVPAPAPAGGDYLMLGGKRYSVTPA
jgi:hypothetical protein